jgi:hypothetical integral membrane protein (TIGR02206 family)
MQFDTSITLATFSPLWWESILWIGASIFLLIQVPKYLKNIKIKQYDFFIAILLIANLCIEQLYNYYNGLWNIQQNIPAHLCSISTFLCIIYLFNKNQLLGEFVYYWGLLGGIHALLTPEFNNGIKGYNFYSYFIEHAGLLLVVLYIIIHNGFKPRPKSWLVIFGYSQLVVLSVGILNYAIDTNYMFLRARPAANNPFIIGDWPFYLISFEIAAIFHFWLFYLPFARKNKIANSALS